MIVISDTTPLRYLTYLGMEELLPRLFGRVHCPDAVICECLDPRAPVMLREWIDYAAATARFREETNFRATAALILAAWENARPQ